MPDCGVLSGCFAFFKLDTVFLFFLRMATTLKQTLSSQMCLKDRIARGLQRKASLLQQVYLAISLGSYCLSEFYLLNSTD